MEDNLDVSSILSHSREAAALRSADVAEDPDLAGGVLLGTSLLGLLTIIWAFWYQRRNLSIFKRTCIMSFCCHSVTAMGIQVIHSSLMFLLTMDALNLIATITFGTEFIRSSCNGVINCSYVGSVWFLSRWFGVILHLQNASLSIIHLCQPQSGASLSSVYSVINVVIIIVVPLYLYVPKAAIFVLAAFIILFALAIIGRSKVSILSPSTVTLKKRIVVVAMCNFLVVYIPTFILQCLLYSTDDYDQLDTYQNVYLNVLVFTNCHLIFDGLQCALILKLPSGEEEQQQQQWQHQQQQQWQPQLQQQQQQWQQQQQQQQQQWQQQQQQKQQQCQQQQLEQPQQEKWQQQQQQQPQQQQWQQQQQQWQHQLQQMWQQQWQQMQLQQPQQQQWQQQQQQQLGYL